MLSAKRALITGITGQDGAYLAKFLLANGYQVFGLTRKSGASGLNDERLRWLGIADDVRLVEGDVTDLTVITRILREIKPDEIYNLASDSFVGSSWQQPLATAFVTGIGVSTILEAMRLECPQARFYQASSSEMYGLVREPRQSEVSPFHPRSPYAVAKAFGHWTVVNYRDNFGIHASNGILFNHESPLRGAQFVSRKVTRGVAEIKLGLAKTLELGNLDARRDWGHAQDYVRAMWLMLQQDQAGDYVIATGRTVSVGEMCRIAFEHVGLRMEAHVVSVAELRRPSEVKVLVGDASKARLRLGWEPEITLEQMICEMVDADLARLARRPKRRALAA
jgi:GDPmannose 4,6-dehydratase